MENRDLLSCHTSLCLGKQLGSWKREIQSSSELNERLNEPKAVCLQIVPLLLLLQCVFVSLCTTWPLCLVSSRDFVVTWVSLCPSFSCSYPLSHVTPLSLRQPSFTSVVKVKSQSFPWWLLSDVGVLKCSKWNHLDVMTSVTFKI